MLSFHQDRKASQGPLHLDQIHQHRRVTYEEDRILEARFRAKHTIAERVIAGWELAKNTYILRGSHEPEKRTGITL